MINLTSNFNIASVFNTRKTAQAQKTSNASYPNLAPLARDTVSFKGNRANAIEPIDMRMLNRAIHNENICKKVSQEALASETSLQETLSPYIKDYVYDSKDKKKKPIFKIESRTKSAASIKEKVLKKYVSENQTSGGKRKIDPLNCLFDEDYIKRKVGDLVGYRIILGSNDVNDTTSIVDGLIKAVNQGKLNINEIQNYISYDLDSQYDYIKRNDLERLRNAVNKRRRAMGQSAISIKYTQKDSGYMAIHIGVDLSNPTNKKSSRHSAEIQIIGHDVAKLKDVEDLCYKLKERNKEGQAIKEIKGAHYAYKPFEKHFYDCLDDPNYTSVTENFAIYTKRAYKAQRLKPLSANFATQRRRNYSFPTIEECGLSGVLPKGLDFNILAKIKDACDTIYNNSSENLV